MISCLTYSGEPPQIARYIAASFMLAALNVSFRNITLLKLLFTRNKSTVFLKNAYTHVITFFS